MSGVPVFHYVITFVIGLATGMVLCRLITDIIGLRAG